MAAPRVVEEVYISGGSARLPGLQRAFEGAFEKSFYDGEGDATDRARRKRNALDAAKR